MVGPQIEAPEPDGGGLLAKLHAARNGTDSDVGRLLESTRRYLLLVANRSLDAQLQQKCAPSDLVQETFVDAHRDFEQFAGTSEGELFAWLRQILIHKASHARGKYLGTAKRNVAKEQSLVDLSNVAGKQPTPSVLAMGTERRRQLSDALQQLPADYRQVIEMRSFERLAFAEIGNHMGRSEDAATKLWCRAIEKLRDVFVASDSSRNV